MMGINYENHTCAVCKMSISLSNDEWIWINIRLKDDLYIPVRVCEAHSTKLLNAAAAKAELAYMEIH